MKNWYFFKFKGSFINENFKPTHNTTEKYHCIKTSAKQSVSPHGIKFLSKINFQPYDEFNFFQGPPQKLSDIHIDNLNESYAINYIYAAEKSKLVWYDLIDKSAIGLKTKTFPAQSNYITFRQDQVRQIDELAIPVNTLMIIRTDIPHQVINESNQMRYCLSLRGFPKLDWVNIVDYFSNHLI